MVVAELSEHNLQVVERLSQVRSAELPRGRVVFLPIFKNNGASLEISLRVHPDGTCGQLPLSPGILETLGAHHPQEQFDELLDMRERFQNLWRREVFVEEEGILEAGELEEETPVPAE